MAISKQIIYPLNYLRPVAYGTPAAESQFKKNFGRICGPNVDILPLGRARMGIYLLTKYAVSEGKNEILLSPYTIPDVINMVRLGGGRPVFVDVKKKSTNINMALLDEAINSNTACVLITHYHVNQNELPQIKSLCTSRNVPLYDDCAISLGGSLQGRPIGDWCDASVFSLSGYKALNFFWGGALTTSDKDLCRFVENEIINWPRLNWKQYAPQMLRILKYDIATRGFIFRYFTHPFLKRSLDRSWEWKILPPRLENKELDETLVSRPAYAALWELNRKIERVDEYQQHRRKIAQVYDAILGDLVVAPETGAETKLGSCFINYPIIVGPDVQKTVYHQVIRKGFDIGLSLYPNVQEHPDFRDVPGITRNVSALVRSVVTLPTHPRISEEYALRLARVVQNATIRKNTD